MVNGSDALTLTMLVGQQNLADQGIAYGDILWNQRAFGAYSMPTVT